MKKKTMNAQDWFALKEADILKQTKNWLAVHGWRVVRMHQSMGSEKGIPDLIAIKGGFTVWIEVKGPKGHLSAHQVAFRDSIEMHGGLFMVVRSLEDLEPLSAIKVQTRHGVITQSNERLLELTIVLPKSSQIRRE